MNVQQNLESPELVARISLLRTWLYGLGLTAGVAALALLLLIQPESGVTDVHIPEALRDSLASIHTTPGEPYIVGPGLGRIPEIAAVAEKIAELVAVILLIWAVIKRRKSVSIACAMALFANQLDGPIAMIMQPEPPIAVSADVGRALVRAIPEAVRENPAQRYLRSQVAYLDGDRTEAKRLAFGLEEQQLASPIEAPYRLQFLRGEPIVTTLACFALGCASPTTRNAALVMASIAFAGSAAAALLALSALTSLRRRITRMEALHAEDRRLRIAA